MGEGLQGSGVGVARSRGRSSKVVGVIVARSRGGSREV